MSDLLRRNWSETTYKISKFLNQCTELRRRLLVSLKERTASLQKWWTTLTLESKMGVIGLFLSLSQAACVGGWSLYYFLVLLPEQAREAKKEENEAQVWERFTHVIDNINQLKAAGNLNNGAIDAEEATDLLARSSVSNRARSYHYRLIGEAEGENPKAITFFRSALGKSTDPVEKADMLECIASNELGNSQMPSGRKDYEKAWKMISTTQDHDRRAEISSQRIWVEKDYGFCAKVPNLVSIFLSEVQQDYAKKRNRYIYSVKRTIAACPQKGKCNCELPEPVMNELEASLDNAIMLEGHDL